MECYGACHVELNLETKLDPLAVNETFPVEAYTKIPEILIRRDIFERTYIQSFDWRTLINIKKAYPDARTVALANPMTTDISIDRGVGGWPWLGGLNLKDFGGDWIKAAASIGVDAVSAWSGGSVLKWVNEERVKTAKELGLGFFAWTVNDEKDVERVLKAGVTGVITDYPEMTKKVAKGLKVRMAWKGLEEKRECWRSGGWKE